MSRKNVPMSFVPNIDIIIQGLLRRDQYSKEKLQEDPASEGDEWETKSKASRVNNFFFLQIWDTLLTKYPDMIVVWAHLGLSKVI